MLFRFVFLLAAILAGFGCDAVLVGGRRRMERPESNLVVHPSRIFYPRSDDVEPCKTDLGLLGLCVDVRLCHAARRAVAAGNHPVRCGWIDHQVPMVCCHPDQVMRPKVIYRPLYDVYG